MTGCFSSNSHPSHTNTGRSAAANYAPVHDNSWRALPRRWCSSRPGIACPMHRRSGRSNALVVRPELLAGQLAGDVTRKLVDHGQPFGHVFAPQPLRRKGIQLVEGDGDPGFRHHDRQADLTPFLVGDTDYADVTYVRMQREHLLDFSWGY